MRGAVLKNVILIELAAILTIGCATVQSNPTTTRDKLLPGEELKRGDDLISENGQYRLILQRDGNLVLYGPRERPLWSSDTEGIPVEKCIMQRDGNLVLYLPTGQRVWASYTHGYPPPFLWLQNDGNLVIYQPVWDSGTAKLSKGWLP